MKSKRFMDLAIGLLVAGMAQEPGYSQVNQGISTPAAQYFLTRSWGNQYSSNASATAGKYVPAPRGEQIYGNKPFHNIQSQPTLSPYLGLDAAPESSTGLPNYYLFVRPQIQQRAANEAQARELQRLRQRVRVASARGGVSTGSAPGIPTTGTSSQFLNMGSYFPGPK